MNTQKELKDWLTTQGFHECKNTWDHSDNQCKWYVCKRYPSQYNCELNDKDGIQIVIWPYRYDINEHQIRNVEIDLTGEANGIWYKFRGYSMSWAELPEKLEQVTDALIKAWEAIPRNINNG